MAERRRVLLVAVWYIIKHEAGVARLGKHLDRFGPLPCSRNAQKCKKGKKGKMCTNECNQWSTNGTLRLGVSMGITVPAFGVRQVCFSVHPYSVLLYSALRRTPSNVVGLNLQ